MKNLILLILLTFSSYSFAQFSIEDLHNSNAVVLENAKLGLTWTPPTFRENGDVLLITELSGYEIYALYPDGTSEVIDIVGGQTTSHEISLTMEGEYVFAMSAIDNDGLRSEVSDILTKTVFGKSRPGKMKDIILNVVCQTGSICNFYQK